MSASSSAKTSSHPLVEQLVQWLPEPVLWFFETFGQAAIYTRHSIRYIAQGRIQWHHVMDQAASLGADAAPMALLICLVAGGVLSLQAALKFVQTGADDYVGGLVSLAIVREISPMFIGLAVGARSGTSIAAEIGQMKVSEQIDALRMMHVDPIRYLMVPRLIACVMVMPLLTMLGNILATVGGMVIAMQVANIHYRKFLTSVWMNLTPYDLRTSIIKAFVLGALLAIVACTLGLQTRGGARGVGITTKRAAIWIAIVMIIADFLLSWMMFGNTSVSPH